MSLSVCSPEGKKFRSRNELRSHFIQIGSTMNSEDFDFSVKGKGHHNKGKSPTKKSETENSKENQVSKKNTTPVVSKRNTPKTNITPNERPKRELRKRLRSEPEEEPVKEPEEEEEEELPEDIEDKDEISNVKLKVKVGYTATGAMIRPSTNGTRKKKRRFRNMHVKKNKADAKPVPKPPASSTRRAVPASADIVKEEKKETTSPRTRQTTKRKRKGKAAEPVAGPSGLQKVKRSPRRVLKRKGGATAGGEGADESEEDDDEDLDYVCSLYPNQVDTGPSLDADPESSTHEISQDATDPLKIDEEDIKAGNSEMNGAEEHDPYYQPSASTNGVTEPVLTCIAEADSVGSMVTVDQTVHMDDIETNDDHMMQVVVIGDTVDVHNYAKPHSL